MLLSRCVYVPAAALVAALSLPLMTAAQKPDLHQQLDAMFNKGAYMAQQVHLEWQQDGQSYANIEPVAGGKGMEIAAYDAQTGKRSVIVSAEQLTPKGAGESGTAGPLAVHGYSWSGDGRKLLIFTNSKRVWRQNTRGDYWLYDTAAGRLFKLGGDAPEATLMFATFSPDASKVAWVRQNNLYVEDLATEKITQLTTDGSGPNGSGDIINGTSDWVSEEELDLRNCFRWSPDGQSIAYWQFDQSGVGEYTLINDTANEYPTTFKYKYPQPGTTNSAVRAGVVSVNGGPTTWIKLDGDPRQNYIVRMEWAGNSRELLLEYLDRLQQDGKLMLADAKTGTAKLFFEDTDKAWVDIVPLDWIGGGSGKEADLLWISERDGWRHAYRVDRRTGAAKKITNFDGDVVSVQSIDNAGGWLYFMASPEDPVREYLYRARLDGTGKPERVTPTDEPGVHRYEIAPGAKWALHTWSTFTTPNRSEIVSLPDHKPARVLATNDELAKKTKDLLPNPPEFFKVPVGNGVVLDGMMIKPPDFDPSKKYPVLTMVYGEPASATVRDSWAGIRGLFHAALAQQGYIICSFDNQGTPAPKGREWRKSIYGAVGVLASAQQAAAIQWLAKERSYIDSSRMAIWGWSGGGSQTLNVMLRYPGVYSTGIAVAPVPDEAHYDTIYQERYMGLPQQNAKGYHDGSPINFADGLKGHLLVVHGSGDDNVHFQGTELLVNKFIELGKPFDFMDYPNRSHGIFEGRGTSYHVYSLIARYLEDHVPPGAR